MSPYLESIFVKGIQDTDGIVIIPPLSNARFLALVLVMTMAYCLATVAGHGLRKLNVNHYVARLNEHCRQRPQHSDFGTALCGHLWCCTMEDWTQLADELMQQKPP